MKIRGDHQPLLNAEGTGGCWDLSLAPEVRSGAGTTSQIEKPKRYMYFGLFSWDIGPYSTSGARDRSQGTG
jgi:hypothetical protein